MLSVTRKDDRVERRGGEEFLLVLAGGEQEGVIKKLAGKKLPVEITAKDGAEQVVEITFSGGVTSFTPGAKSLEEGIMAADKALYIAKEEGRNQILIAEEK